MSSPAPACLKGSIRRSLDVLTRLRAVKEVSIGAAPANRRHFDAKELHRRARWRPASADETSGSWGSRYPLLLSEPRLQPDRDYGLDISRCDGEANFSRVRTICALEGACHEDRRSG